MAVALAACSGATTQASPSTSTGATTTTAGPSRPFSVTKREFTIEDTSRTTRAIPERDLTEKPSRTLPVMVLAPDGPGPFPIFEYSHGQNGSGPGGETLLRPIAAAGYVVVAPTFPLSSSPIGDIADFVNQPADVFFAVDAVIKMANDPSDPLHGRVDSTRIALGGHSLGAMTTVGAAYNSCCSQPRVAAAIVLSGIEAPFGSGTYEPRPAVPLLLAHGAMDARIPVSASDDLFVAATGPTAYLRFPDGTHGSILAGDDATLVQHAVIAWLDKWLRDDGTGLDGLSAAVTTSGVATLQTKNL